MINSRDINELTVEAHAKCEAFINACKDRGIDILITSTYRDNASQEALYQQGRSLPGKRVTNAPAGRSFHNYRVAFDFVPLINGKPVWDNNRLFLECGEIAESVGLEWAGRWKTFPEMAHCQYTSGRSIDDFISNK